MKEVVLFFVALVFGISGQTLVNFEESPYDCAFRVISDRAGMIANADCRKRAGFGKFGNPDDIHTSVCKNLMIMFNCTMLIVSDRCGPTASRLFCEYDKQNVHDCDKDPCGPSPTCPLTAYRGSQFQGAAVRVHKDFVPLLEQINRYAEEAHVHVYVTSSFRSSSEVSGSIVDPAKMSNHLVGQAIDMNVIYGSGKWCNSKCLAELPLPPPVHAFISKVRDNPNLRWGGDFRTPDPVHIDTGLNVYNYDKWQQEFRAVKNYCHN